MTRKGGKQNNNKSVQSNRDHNGKGSKNSSGTPNKPASKSAKPVRSHTSSPANPGNVVPHIKDKKVRKHVKDIRTANRPSTSSEIGYHTVQVRDSLPDLGSIGRNSLMVNGGTFYLQTLAVIEASMAWAASKVATPTPYPPTVMRAWLYWVAMQTYTATGYFKLGQVSKGVGPDFDYNVGTVQGEWFVPTALLYQLSYGFNFHRAGLEYIRDKSFPVPGTTLSGDLQKRVADWPNQMWGTNADDMLRSVTGNFFLQLYTPANTPGSPTSEVYVARSQPTTIVFADFYNPPAGSQQDNLAIGRSMSNYWQTVGGVPYRQLERCMNRRVKGNLVHEGKPTAPDGSAYLGLQQSNIAGRFNEQITIYSDHPFYDKHVVPFIQACSIPEMPGVVPAYQHTSTTKPEFNWNANSWEKGNGDHPQGVHLQYTAYYTHILNELGFFNPNGIKAALKKNRVWGHLRTSSPRFELVSFDGLNDIINQHLVKISTITGGDTRIPEPKFCQYFYTMVNMIAYAQLVKQSGGMGSIILTNECVYSLNTVDASLLTTPLPPIIADWISRIGPTIDNNRMKIFIPDMRPTTNWVTQRVVYNYANVQYTGSHPPSVNQVAGVYSPGTNIPAFMGRWYVSLILPGVYQANNVASTQPYSAHIPYQVGANLAQSYTIDNRYQMLESIDLYTDLGFNIDQSVVFNSAQSRYPVGTSFTLTPQLVNNLNSYETLTKSWIAPCTFAAGSEVLEIVAQPGWNSMGTQPTDLYWMVPTVNDCECINTQRWGTTVLVSGVGVAAKYTYNEADFGAAVAYMHVILWYTGPGTNNQRPVYTTSTTVHPLGELINYTMSQVEASSTYDLVWRQKFNEFSNSAWTARSSSVFAFRAAADYWMQQFVKPSNPSAGKTGKRKIFLSTTTQEVGLIGPENVKSSKDALNGPNFWQILTTTVGTIAGVVFPEFTPFIAPLVGIANDLLADKEKGAREKSIPKISRLEYYSDDCKFMFTPGFGWTTY